VVLAGGKGTRLGPLTRNECKPALPFGVRHRNIDFTLSNCINSGIRRIGVATHYKDASLNCHIARVWARFEAGVEVEPWRAGEQAGNGGYRGTADAVYRNWAAIEVRGARLVLVLAGDHVYKMDYRPFLHKHVVTGADLTVGCVEIPIESAHEFGVMSVDAAHRIVRFAEKPRVPEALPGQPHRALGSMGIYVFNRDFLGRILSADSECESSSHDFGHDLLPRLIDTAKVFAYPFTAEAPVGAGYWRDVGTVHAYWQAHMELLDCVPGLDLDDSSWPVRSIEQALDAEPGRESGIALPNGTANSMIAGGCKIDRAQVKRSVLFAGVSVASDTSVWNAVILPGATIGRQCVLGNVIVASGTRVPDGTVVAPCDGEEGPTLVTEDLYGANRTTGSAGMEAAKVRRRASGLRHRAGGRASGKHPEDLSAPGGIVPGMAAANTL